MPSGHVETKGHPLFWLVDFKGTPFPKKVHQKGGIHWATGCWSPVARWLVQGGNSFRLPNPTALNYLSPGQLGIALKSAPPLEHLHALPRRDAAAVLGAGHRLPREHHRVSRIRARGASDRTRPKGRVRRLQRAGCGKPKKLEPFRWGARKYVWKCLFYGTFGKKWALPRGD